MFHWIKHAIAWKSHLWHKDRTVFICWYSVFGLILVTMLIAILVTSSCLSVSVFADTIMVQIIWRWQHIGHVLPALCHCLVLVWVKSMAKGQKGDSPTVINCCLAIRIIVMISILVMISTPSSWSPFAQSLALSWSGLVEGFSQPMHKCLQCYEVFALVLCILAAGARCIFVDPTWFLVFGPRI